MGKLNTHQKVREAVPNLKQRIVTNDIFLLENSHHNSQNLFLMVAEWLKIYP